MSLAGQWKIGCGIEVLCLARLLKKFILKRKAGYRSAGRDSL